MPGVILLKKVELFNGLADRDLEEVWKMLQPRRLAAGEILFNQGDPGDELIVIESGQVSIFAPVDTAAGPIKPIRIFQPGETLGEMALIDQKPRSLSARAEEDSTILTLNGAGFRRLLKAYPEVAISVMSGLSERVRYTTEFLNEVRLWVRRIAEGSYNEAAQPAPNLPYRDSTLAALAAEFAQMAAKVQERENTLRQEVVQLRIEIDEAKRKREVETITQSDYYMSLKDKVKKLRQQKADAEEG